MDIGEIKEIGERVVETPKLQPRAPERNAPAPVRREKEKA